MVSLSTVFSTLSPRRALPMVSTPTRKAFVKEETPYAPPTTPSPFVQLPPTLNTSPQPNLQPSPSPQNDAPSPDSPDGSGDDFLADIFSDSDDDSDSDSDDDRRPYPKFDYDARFRPLEHLDLAQVRDPGPGAELCYALEDFGPDNMKSWCLPDFVKSEVFAIVKGGEPVDFITEFNEFFWRESLSPLSFRFMILSEAVIKVHSTGKPGVVPAFNIEGQLERKARENKEANEKVCRVPASFPPGSFTTALFDSKHATKPLTNEL